MVSSAIDEYLAAHGNGETFDTILAKPAIKPLPSFDGSQPLTHYFISSSHNTYLLSNQLWGAASPKAYTSAIKGLAARAPARCVEIDVWYTKKGPIVTHGHTFTGSIPFKDVCDAIGEAVEPNDLPTFISLECHVDPEKQPELVQIMRDAFGEKLLTERVQHLGEEHVSPDDLKGRIVMMVEWYPTPGTAQNTMIKTVEEESSDSDDSDSDNSEVEEMKEFRKAHANHKAKISGELAQLGIYANSIKPKDGWLERQLVEPVHALINISESALLGLLKQKESAEKLIDHAHHYLRRCYPHGLRVNSTNVDPMPIWKCGTHVVGLNMQKWDKGTHINGALFRDTDGWVLKPESLRGGPKRSGTAHLKLNVIGGDDIPRGNENDANEAVYIVTKLYTHEKTHETKGKTVKKHGGDPMFGTTADWTFPNDDLLFVRIELKRDDWGVDDLLGSYTVLVDRLENGLHFWPLFDPKGDPSLGRLLVDVDYTVQ